MMIASSAYETNPSLIQDYVTQIDRLLEHATNAGEQESLMHALRKSLAKVEKRVEKPLKGLPEAKSQVELHAQAAATKAARAADAKVVLANAYTRAAEAKAKAPQKAANHDQQQHRMLEEDEHIDLLAFSTLIRTREGVDVEDDVIKKIFAAFDADHSGTISVHEYLVFSLCDRLMQTNDRVIDLFKKWDEDNSGEIDEREFFRAVTALGFAVPATVASKVFKSLDTDHSKSLKYAELAEMLKRRNVGAVASKQELLRYTPGGQQANRDTRGAKASARDSYNYVAVRTRALPAEARIDPHSPVPVMEQLGALLTANAQTVIRLFLDWDEDGNGAVDKAEFRRALQGLNYKAPTKTIDALFDSLDAEKTKGSAGFLEIEEINKGLAKFVRASNSRAPPPLPEPTALPLENDEQLDLLAFAQLARAREGDRLDDQTIQKMFHAYDTDGNGTVSAHEYLTFSLREALLATNKRAVDLFKQWDENKDGMVSESEFKRAILVLGYAVPAKVAVRLFRKLDEDRTGSLQYKELFTLLSKPQPGADASKAELLRYTPGGQVANRDNRLGKPSARDSYNYETVRTRTLPAEARLDPDSDLPVLEQLGTLLTIHAKTITNLLRDWDEDGNGGVDKKEFRRALYGLGYNVPKSDIDALFDVLDCIRPDGFLEYDEMQKGLRKFVRALNAPSRVHVHAPPGQTPGGLAPINRRGKGMVGRLHASKSEPVIKGSLPEIRYVPQAARAPQVSRVITTAPAIPLGAPAAPHTPLGAIPRSQGGVTAGSMGGTGGQLDGWAEEDGHAFSMYAAAKKSPPGSSSPSRAFSQTSWRWPYN